jgi:hypothetical protein
MRRGKHSRSAQQCRKRKRWRCKWGDCNGQRRSREEEQLLPAPLLRHSDVTERMQVYAGSRMACSPLKRGRDV